MPSASRPKSTRSKPASIRASKPKKTSPPSAGSSNRSASPTTGAASWRPPTSITFRWTQWIFLQIYDTWFDAEQQKGRPISELPIPADIKGQGADAVRAYQDEHRLAYQSEAPVNWCPALGTVLANEEVVNGKSEVGGHPVTRLPLRQWMLRITAYADRLERELEGLDWPEGIKHLQRNWIGRSTGAEVDFYLGNEKNYDDWKAARAEFGLPSQADRRFPAHLHHAARHALRRNLHGDRARASIR